LKGEEKISSGLGLIDGVLSTLILYNEAELVGFFKLSWVIQEF
jgi:hypothetical protein